MINSIFKKKMKCDRIIWIRHAEKLYDNEKGPDGCRQHDPGLIMNLKLHKNIDYLVNNLIKNYGVPNKIICSPFLRTRQTMNLIVEKLNNKNNINIEYSNNIAEYLGYCKSSIKRADIELETKHIMNIPVLIGESIESLDSRVERHLNDVENQCGTIWVITHGIIISKIFKLISGQKLNRPEPLDSLVYTNDQLINVKLF